jgi:STE24 endopeptidase
MRQPCIILSRVSNALMWLFIAALATAGATRLWLARRQIRHVLAHRAAVPATFAEAIPLAAHQKAADYTAAKSRLGMADVLINAALLLLLTLGGVLQWLSTAWASAFQAGGVAHGTALLLSLFLLQALAGLPTTLLRTFGVEARFGFCWRCSG